MPRKATGSRRGPFLPPWTNWKDRGTDRQGCDHEGESYSRDFRGPNWLDRRRSAAAYIDRDPAVLVVGGGQAGLSSAARLAQLQVDTLIVDREPRIGDTGASVITPSPCTIRCRSTTFPIHAISAELADLHPQGQACRLVRGLCGKHGAQLLASHRTRGRQVRRTKGTWSVVLRHAHGTQRKMHPRHIVMATGVSGIPSLPDIPSLQNFTGKVLHSSQYDDGEAWQRQRRHCHRHRQQRA